MAVINVPDTDSFDLWRQKTNLISLVVGDLDRLAVSMNYPIAGTVSSFGTSLVGVGTSFLTELNVGTIVRTPTGVQRKIVAITSNTAAQTDTAFTPALANSLISTVDFVTALNTAFLSGNDEHRANLIRAIAMS